MSTAYSSAKQQYIGNGVTTEWGFDFPIQKHSELKVYLKRSGMTQVLLEEGVDYSFVTDNTIAFPIKTGEAKLQATDVLALQRESVFESEYNFSNQQRLEPEEVMHADDNLERQIQELKRDVTQAIRIQPTSNIDTDEYFIAVESIYENLDNITNVSGISAEIVNCSDNISDISTVSSDIANVNTVGQSISNVNTVAGNISSVNVAAANIEFIKDAENNANDAKNSKIEAQNSAVTAQLMATQAQEWATKTDGKVDGTNYSSKYYAGQASTSAQAAQDALNNVNGLIATPIGTIFMSIYVDESLDIARRLNGQLISSTKFTGFRTWLNDVQTATPNLFTTETNWQAEKTNSKLGQCGKFVIDDTAGTIRLPCVVNAQGLVDLQFLGTIKSESLPNITGLFYGENERLQGCFNSTTTYSSKNALTSDSSSPARGEIQFNASRSSSTYQDNAPVQQEAIQYPYYIQVATGIEETLPAIREYKTNVPYVLGDSKYSETNPYNASWLVSNGQYNAKTTYPDMWTQLQVELNSSLNKGDTVVIDGKTYVKRGLPVKLSTASYTDYDWIVNTSEETFRLPLLNGSEDLPSDRYENLTISAKTQRFTAPANGIYTVSGVGFGWVDILNETSGNFGSCSQPRTGDGYGRYTVNAKQGDQIVIFCSVIPNSYICRFIYAQGNGSLYYYVGDTVQDASLINAGAVLGQLSNKADIDASNFNADGKSLLSGLGMPSGRYIDLTLGASGSTYTAPANGWFSFKAHSQSAGSEIQIYNLANNLFDHGWDCNVLGKEVSAQLQFKKGQNAIIYTSGAFQSDDWYQFRFVYAEGDQ